MILEKVYLLNGTINLLYSHAGCVLIINYFYIFYIKKKWGVEWYGKCLLTFFEFEFNVF